MPSRLISVYRDAFSGLPRRIWLLALVTLIHRSGTMVVPFLTIYMTTQLGMSVRVAGLYLGLYGVGGVLGAFVGARLAERVGNVRAMQLVLIVGGVGFMTLGVLRDPWAIGAVLLVTSVATEAFRTPSSADIGLTAAPELRSRAFALRRVAINLGMAIGPAVGGVLATIDYTWLFAIDGGTCMLAALAVWLLLERLERAGPAHGGAPEPIDKRWLRRDPGLVVVLGCASVMNIAFMQIFGTYPLTLKQAYGHSEAVIGALMALNTLLIVAFEMVVQHRLAATRPLGVTAAGSGALMLGYLLVPLDPSIALAIVAITVITVGEMLTFPVLEGYIVGRAPKAAMSRAIGLLNACFASTFVIAPVLGTAVYDAWGYRALWLSCAALAGLAAAGFVMINLRTRRAGREVVL